MRMRRGGGNYQNNDRGGMGGQPGGYNGGAQNNYMGQNSGNFGGDRAQGGDKPFFPPQSRGNYKTELCKYFSQGNCPYATRCSFAHGQHELKDKPAFSGNTNTSGASTPGYQGNYNAPYQHGA